MFDPSARRKVGAGLFVLSVAFVGAPRTTDASTVSCKIPQPCALYTNGTGAGLEGATTFAATSSSNATFGLEGLDSSTNKNKYNVGVYGYSPYGTGLRGFAPSGTGVVAASTSGTGLVATSASNTAIVGSSTSANGIVGKTSGKGSSYAGVTGTDASTNGGTNVGVLGTTTNGGYGVEASAGDNASGAFLAQSSTSVAVRASSVSNTGVLSMSKNGYGVYGVGGTVGVIGFGPIRGVEGDSTTNPGVLGVSASGIGVAGSSTSGAGLAAFSNSGDALDATTPGDNIGVYAVSTKGDGADVNGGYIGVVARSNSYPILATNAGGADLFYVDGSGNVFTHGSYQTFVATRGGAASTAFTTRSTTPNVEDVGGARLVNGTATVAFDPAFGASIDAHAPYHVFLTPNGDTHGLYVAMKTPAGFVVRETEGGHGTFDFDYRVVAAAPGQAQERMALVGPSYAAGPRAAIVPHRAFVAPKPISPPTVRERALR